MNAWFVNFHLVLVTCRKKAKHFTHLISDDVKVEKKIHFMMFFLFSHQNVQTDFRFAGHVISAEGHGAF